MPASTAVWATVSSVAKDATGKLSAVTSTAASLAKDVYDDIKEDISFVDHEQTDNDSSDIKVELQAQTASIQEHTRVLAKLNQPNSFCEDKKMEKNKEELKRLVEENKELHQTISALQIDKLAAQSQVNNLLIEVEKLQNTKEQNRKRNTNLIKMNKKLLQDQKQAQSQDELLSIKEKLETTKQKLSERDAKHKTDINKSTQKIQQFKQMLEAKAREEGMMHEHLKELELSLKQEQERTIKLKRDAKEIEIRYNQLMESSLKAINESERDGNQKIDEGDEGDATTKIARLRSQLQEKSNQYSILQHQFTNLQLAHKESESRANADITDMEKRFGILNQQISNLKAQLAQEKDHLQQEIQARQTLEQKITKNAIEKKKILMKHCVQRK